MMRVRQQSLCPATKTDAQSALRSQPRSAERPEVQNIRIVHAGGRRRISKNFLIKRPALLWVENPFL